MLQRTALLLPAVVLLPLLTGCPPDAQRHQENVRLITDAQDSYDKKLYGRAIESATAVLKQTPTGDEAAQAHYLRGAAYALSQRRSAAYVDLRSAATLAQAPETRWKAHALIGVLYFEDEDWASAADSMAAAASADPKNPQLDFQLFRQAQSLERTGRWSDAQSVFSRIVYSLPKGNFTDASLRRLQQKPTCFAVRCGLFDERRNADKLVADLRTKGHSAYIIAEQRGKISASVVLVGRFATYNEAKQELARIKGAVSDAVIWP